MHSLQYAQALIHNKEHDPLQLKFSLEAIEEALTTLKQHDLFADYFGPNEEPPWIQQRRQEEADTKTQKRKAKKSKS